MNDIRFENRVAIITGAGNGIGRAVALDLAARGAAVIVNDLGCDPWGHGVSHKAADRVVREITQAGGKAVGNYDTVATRAGGQAMVDLAMDVYGRVDIVFSNAGILQNAPFEHMTDESLRAVLDTHLMGAFHVCQPAYRLMKKQSYGRIIMACSASGMFGNPWQTNYGAAKAGLVGLVHTLSIEGRAHGVLVNGLLPCHIGRLGMDAAEWPTGYGSEAAEDGPVVAPYNDAAYVAPMVTWLASERCNVTHALYSATAGRYARVFVGAADGWLGPLDHPPRAEEIEDHLGQVEDTRVYHRPENVFEEFKPIAAAIRSKKK